MTESAFPRDTVTIGSQKMRRQEGEVVEEGNKQVEQVSFRMVQMNRVEEMRCEGGLIFFYGKKRNARHVRHPDDNKLAINLSQSLFVFTSIHS